MKKIKYGEYRNPEDVQEAINTLIFPYPRRNLIQITPISKTFLGSSVETFLIWYTEEDER